MTTLEPELDRIGALLRDAIDADLAKGKAFRLVSVRDRFQRASTAFRWSALVCSSGLIAAVLTVVFVGGSEQLSFAGWSAHPSKPAVGQLTSANTSCEGAFAQVPTSVIQGANLATLTPEVSDVRGPYTVTVFGDGSASGAMCFSAPGGNATVQWITWSDTPVTTSAIALNRVSVLFESGQPYTLVEGRTGDGVTGVELSLENGSQVTATVGHGFFLAWWPGNLSSTAAVVATASGSSIQSLAPASSSGSNSVCHNGSCG
jgi:hypothetical protein